MTEDEAVNVARSFAIARKWPWYNPVSAKARRRFLIFGLRTWRVQTNPGHILYRDNGVIYISDHTGEILKHELIPCPPPDDYA